MKLNALKTVHLTAAFLAALFVTMALFAFYPGKSNRFLLTANMEKPVMVFVLAGQSNAVGYNHISQLPSGDERLPLIRDSLSGVLLWPGTNANPEYAGTWTNLKPGVQQTSSGEESAVKHISMHRACCSSVSVLPGDTSILPIGKTET